MNRFSLKICFYPRLAALITSLAFGATSTAQETQELDHDLVETLSAAIDTWHQQVEFSCHWVMSETAAASREDAAAGRFQQPLEKEAEGRYAKAGDLIYSSIDYGRPPKKVGNNSITESSVKQARSGEMTIRFRFRDQHASGWFTPLDDQIKATQSPVAGVATNVVMNPLLSLNDGRSPNFIRRFGDFKQAGDHVDFQVTRIDADHLQVRMVHKMSEGSNTIRLRFWMKPNVPVIDRITGDSRNDGNGWSSYMDQHYGDFVQVDGGMVARKIWIACPTNFKLADSPCKVDVWESSDLGQNPPQKEDFLLQVPAGTEIHCLKPAAQPEPVAGVRTYDISKLSLDDLLPECRGEASGERLAEYWWIRWLCVLVGATAAIYLAVALWRKKGRMPAIR